MEQQNKFKMHITARVNCPVSPLRNNAARYHDKQVTVIDFCQTHAGLVAVSLVDDGDKKIFFPFHLIDLVLDK